MEVLSVNQALDRLVDLDGRPVYIHGELRFEFEWVAIEHVPRAERREDSFPSRHIWLSCEPPLGFDESVLTRWAGRHVPVEGRLVAAPQGAGHLLARAQLRSSPRTSNGTMRSAVLGGCLATRS